MITVASCANANIMGGPRIIVAMAREGLLPHLFTVVNKGGTPTLALLLTAVFSVGLAVSGAFERVFALIGTLNGIGAIAMALALFILRRPRAGACAALSRNSVSLPARADAYHRGRVPDPLFLDRHARHPVCDRSVDCLHSLRHHRPGARKRLKKGMLEACALPR